MHPFQAQHDDAAQPFGELLHVSHQDFVLRVPLRRLVGERGGVLDPFGGGQRLRGATVTVPMGEGAMPCDPEDIRALAALAPERRERVPEGDGDFLHEVIDAGIVPRIGTRQAAQRLAVLVEHTLDVGVRAQGPSRAAAPEAAAPV